MSIVVFLNVDYYGLCMIGLNLHQINGLIAVLVYKYFVYPFCHVLSSFSLNLGENLSLTGLKGFSEMFFFVLEFWLFMLQRGVINLTQLTIKRLSFPHSQ